MSRRTALVVALVLSLIATFGPRLPTVIAQEATPTAAPAQDLLPADIPVGEAETVDINDVAIHYEVYGEGDPVILLHGGLSNGDHFAHQIPALAENYQVIVMDSRGHGRSSFDETPISYQVMASDVLGLMDHLGIERADIVGWSDGGIIGIELAITNPERVNKVVAYGANYDPTGVIPDVVNDPGFIAYVTRAAEEYAMLSPEPERWEEFLGNISNMWATLPTYTEEQLGTITTPILVLQGETEEAIDYDHAAMMASLIPGSEFVVLPGTGHFAMFEQPEEFNQIVMEFLAS